MKAVDRVNQTKRSLSLIMGSAAIFWAGAALFAGLAVVVLLRATLRMPAALALALPLLAILAGIGTLVFLLYKSRFAWSFDKVALWIEEKAPQLRYALVTAIDPRFKESASIFDPIVAKVDTAPFVREAAKKSTLPAFAALLVTGALFFFIPKDMRSAIGLDGLFAPRTEAPAVMGNRLVPLYATLTPPGYANLPTQQIEEPTTISSLQGSKLVLTGKGTPDGITVAQEYPGQAIEPRELTVVAGGEGWMLTLDMVDSVPSLLRFRDRQYTRPLVIIDPLKDQPPVAKLLLPMRDTTLRIVNNRITGRLELSTDLRDDIGIARAEYEMTIASGGGGGGPDANFEFRDTVIGRRSFGGARTGRLEHNLTWASLGLEEGDQIFVRAVVYDNNGYAKQPGKGYSETRTIRVATSSEYDTLNVNPAPPSADTALVTLRMLIIATEKLDTAWQKKAIERKVYTDSSQKLGGISEKVRNTINRIIDEQTGGGEIDADPRLVLARDSMWSASRSLFIAETWVALPALYAAYKAIQDYSNTARYYIRGVLRVEPVNIDRVRLTGKDSANVTARSARSITGEDRARMQGRYGEAVKLLTRDTTAAVERLTMLQVEAMGKQYSELATHLGDAIAAITEKKDPALHLFRARQFLEGNAEILTTLPSWSGSW